MDSSNQRSDKFNREVPAPQEAFAGRAVDLAGAAAAPVIRGSFKSTPDHDGVQKVIVMQVAQSGHFGEIGPIEGNRSPSSDAGLDASVYAEPIREEIALLLKPNRDRIRVPCLVAGALLAGIAMGWAGSSTWHSHSTVAALAPMAKPTSRQSETKSASNVENIRKPTPVASAPKSQGVSTSATRADAEGANSAPAFTASIGAPETRTPTAPVPETRPTTIDGWTVLEVRGGSSAVLEGPSGVRTVALGDTVPGIGRIDSIVRWGNRWIVATASGLIATR